MSPDSGGSSSVCETSTARGLRTRSCGAKTNSSRRGRMDSQLFSFRNIYCYATFMDSQIFCFRNFSAFATFMTSQSSYSSTLDFLISQLSLLRNRFPDFATSSYSYYSKKLWFCNKKLRTYLAKSWLFDISRRDGFREVRKIVAK